jgi:DNA-binding Lrp family transcriptional regulator
MTIAYVLITILPSYEHDVNNKLSKVAEIIELYPLFGEYDFIVKIEAKDYEKLAEILINKIRPIKGIIDTKTLTGVKF